MQRVLETGCLGCLIEVWPFLSLD